MTAENATVNAYLRTKVLTASPEQLRLMLIEGAIKFTQQGVDALRNKDWEGVYNGYMQARNIVLELMNSVRPDIDPELCSRVSSLYMYMYQQLVDSGFEKDIPKGENVVKLLEYERETWLMLMDRVQQERSGAIPASPAPVHTAPHAAAASMSTGATLPAIKRPVPPSDAPARPALSIQG